MKEKELGLNRKLLRILNYLFLFFFVCSVFLWFKDNIQPLKKINISYLSAPIKVSRQDGRLSLICQRMELGEPDASGRRRPVPIKGSEYSTEFDTVVAAIGQASDVPEGFGVETGRGNIIKADPATLATSRPGVFAGGDVAIGPDSVIRAIAQGRLAIFVSMGILPVFRVWRPGPNASTAFPL